MEFSILYVTYLLINMSFILSIKERIDINTNLLYFQMDWSSALWDLLLDGGGIGKWLNYQVWK